MAKKGLDNVLKDLLSFSYPRTVGSPVIAYNIDAGTGNLENRGTGVGEARR